MTIYTRPKPASDCCESSTRYRYLPHSVLAPYLKVDCLHIRVSKFTVEYNIIIILKCYNHMGMLIS